MRQSLWVLLVLLGAVTLSGCHQEKNQVETYLREHEASYTAMTALGEELKAVMLEVQAAQAADSYQPEDVKGMTRAIETKMRAEKARFEAVVTPEKCQALKTSTLQQYDAVIAVLAKTPAIIDASQKMADSIDALRGAPKEKKQEFLLKLKPIEETLTTLQRENTELASAGSRAQRAAEAEKRRLQEEFGLPATSESPTPSTTPSLGDH